MDYANFNIRIYGTKDISQERLLATLEKVPFHSVRLRGPRDGGDQSVQNFFQSETSIKYMRRFFNIRSPVDWAMPVFKTDSGNVFIDIIPEVVQGPQFRSLSKDHKGSKLDSYFVEMGIGHYSPMMDARIDAPVDVEFLEKDFIKYAQLVAHLLFDNDTSRVVLTDKTGWNFTRDDYISLTTIDDFIGKQGSALMNAHSKFWFLISIHELESKPVVFPEIWELLQELDEMN